MKVSTDGILLGAWADLQAAHSLLDIGTGTGLLALMCQQRNPDITVSGVEIDTDAYNQALYNIAQSPWPKIKVHAQRIQDFNSEKPFDVIISNPPYFNASLKGEDEARNVARHTDTLSFTQLLDAVIRLSHSSTRFSVILPCSEAQTLSQLASHKGLYLNAHCLVQANKSKPFSRSLMTFSFNNKGCEESTLCIKNNNNQYTDDYIALCKAFYLKM